MSATKDYKWHTRERDTWMVTSPTLPRGIVIHRHMDYEPDVWLCSVSDLEIEKHVLKAKDVPAAQVEAVKFVKEYVNKLAVDLGMLPK